MQHSGSQRGQVVFSSAALPAELDDRKRFRLWRDIHYAEIAALDYAVSGAVPFEAQISLTPLGKVALGETVGTIQSVDRTKQNILADEGSGHSLFINTGAGRLGGTHLGHEFLLDPGAAVLISNTDPCSLYGGEKNGWLCLVVPNGDLKIKCGDPTAALATPIDAQNEALTLLRRYCCFLEADAPLTSPALIEHAAQAVIDLIGLSSGLKARNSADAGATGLRAARLAAIGAKIRQRFDDPALSAKTLARELGLSPRYIYNLLQETGISLSDRVMELRLLKSRSMLANRRNDHLRISEIALSCGFGDISYFNRNFRRRFGCAPNSFR